MVTVPVSPDGKVKIYDYGGAAHAIVDVLGWYAKDDSVRPTKGMGTQFETTESGDPERMYDSRQDERAPSSAATASSSPTPGTRPRSLASSGRHASSTSPPWARRARAC